MDKNEYAEYYYEEILEEIFKSKQNDDEEEENLEKIYNVKPGIDFPYTLNKK